MVLAFNQMQALMIQDCLLAYPIHNKPIHIYPDASSYQMGAYIVQDNKPVAFWSCKLNDDQLKYTVGDKELLSIVMVLMELHTIFPGTMLHIYTNHLNITTNNPTPDCITHWLNYVEQLNSEIHFILGKDNFITNTLFGLVYLKESVLLKTNMYLFLKFLSPKGWTLPMTHFSLNVFCVCHLWKYKILTRLIINGSLPNKM